MSSSEDSASSPAEPQADTGSGPPGPSSVASHARAGPLRRLYGWVLGWAYSRHALWALFVLSLAEASFFPIPPDPLLMALCLGSPRRAFRFAGWATGASVLGGMLGYAIGAGAWGLLDDFFFRYVPGVTPEAFEQVQGLYDQYDFWAVFLAGLTPLPYKVFTLSAGVFSINFPVFVLASGLSRGLRFYVVAALIYRYGPPVSRFIDRYFNLLTVTFGVLLVLGFLAITWLL